MLSLPNDNSTMPYFLLLSGEVGPGDRILPFRCLHIDHSGAPRPERPAERFVQLRRPLYRDPPEAEALGHLCKVHVGEVRGLDPAAVPLHLVLVVAPRLGEA